MSKRCKWTVFSIIGAILMLMALGIIKLLFFSGLFRPLLELKGDQTMEIEVNSTFEDPGAIARFRFSDYSDEINVHSSLNTSKLGEYNIRYTLEAYDKEVNRTVRVVDTTAPTIQLKQGTLIRVFENGTFEDPGYRANDNYDGDVSKQVKVDASNVNMKQQGKYEVIYTVNDSSGNRTEMKRIVEVCQDPTTTKIHYQHDSYDNTAEEWWFRKSEQHQRTTAARDAKMLEAYDAYYLGPDEKTIYLTFDEGGNNITYINEIVGVLNDNDVKATFFLTRNYIKDNPEFINDLVANGHLVANHSWHHYDMPTLANANDIDKFVLEITETEKTYMEVVGEPMKKVFRFPKGGMSERALKITQDLGYTNYFWSHAYYDYAEDVSGEEALKTLVDHYHNGAIYLLHPSNKGNYLAMDPFIKYMKKQGFTFATVDTISPDQN